MSIERCHYCQTPVIPPDEIGAALRALGPEATLDQATAVRRRMRVIDHKTPLAHGGSNRRGNRVVACSHCNSRKGSRPYLDFLFATWHSESMSA